MGGDGLGMQHVSNYSIRVQKFSRRMEKKTPGVRRMTSMKDAGGDAEVKMGRALSTNKKFKWTYGLQCGTKGSGR